LREPASALAVERPTKARVGWKRRHGPPGAAGCGVLTDCAATMRNALCSQSRWPRRSGGSMSGAAAICSGRR